MSYVMVVSLNASRAVQLVRSLQERGWETRFSTGYLDAIYRIDLWPPDAVVFDVLSPTQMAVDQTQPGEFQSALREYLRRRSFGVVYLVARAWPFRVLGHRSEALGPWLRKPVAIEPLDDVLRRLTAPVVPLCGEITVETSTGVLRSPAGMVRLTRIEQRLLMHLAGSPGRLFDHQEIGSTVWGWDDPIGASHVIQAHLTNIRRKLRPLGLGGLVVTFRGRGYMFAPGVSVHTDDSRGAEFARLQSTTTTSTGGQPWQVAAIR